MVFRNHGCRKILLIAMVFMVAVAFSGLGQKANAEPKGKVTYAIHVNIKPTWFEPREVPGLITPFMFIYAMHDALCKPMPEGLTTLSLAESLTQSPDGLIWEFKLRKGIKFHNGEPFTSEDVKYTYDTYRGASKSLFQKKVKEVQTPDDYTVRFVLNEPWPDFKTFYCTPASGLAWIVPKDYASKVGDDGYKKKPIGLGPYKFKNFKPGIELVLEANENYWKKTPKVKTIVMKSVKEGATRLAMLKRGEVDIAYNMSGPLGDEVKKDPNLSFVFSGGMAVWWIEFFDQWDPKSPFHDRRVRLAVNYALDRQAISCAETQCASTPEGNIIPREFEGTLELPPYPYDPQKAKELLAEAGYPNGFDAGDLTPIPRYFSMAEAIAGYLGAVGIKVKVRTMERGAMIAKWKQHKLKNLGQIASGALGNAATRLSTYVVSSGKFAYGGYKDLDELFAKASAEQDAKKREALLHQVQQMAYDRVMHAPIYALHWPNGVGPRVKVSGMGLIPGFYYTGPFEEIELK
jgi:peptide/nickel transport system substrate-binding protein